MPETMFRRHEKPKLNSNEPGLDKMGRQVTRAEAEEEQRRRKEDTERWREPE